MEPKLNPLWWYTWGVYCVWKDNKIYVHIISSHKWHCGLREYATTELYKNFSKYRLCTTYNLTNGIEEIQPICRDFLNEGICTYDLLNFNSRLQFNILKKKEYMYFIYKLNLAIYIYLEWKLTYCILSEIYFEIWDIKCTCGVLTHPP